MNSSHYPSLELCKKLTEAGFGRTEKYWMKPKSIPYILYTYEHTSNAFQRYDYWCPSVMELLDAIPTELEFENGTLSYLWMSIDRGVGYNGFHTVDYGTLPNALAEMWLWLKENNYLTK